MSSKMFKCNLMKAHSIQAWSSLCSFSPNLLSRDVGGSDIQVIIEQNKICEQTCSGGVTQLIQYNNGALLKQLLSDKHMYILNKSN